ncbi:MAG TPA: hypothetical protein V6D48_13050, partial [Oculatellaceae cyanobacterium]
SLIANNSPLAPIPRTLLEGNELTSLTSPPSSSSLTSSSSPQVLDRAKDFRLLGKANYPGVTR